MTPKELAAAVLKQITEHPETHDQEVWASGPGIFGDRVIGVSGLRSGACDTTACVAGWTVILAYEDGLPLDSSRMLDYISLEAERLLGLTDLESMWLFSVTRSHDEITAALQRMVAGEPVLPVVLRIVP